MYYFKIVTACINNILHFTFSHNLNVVFINFIGIYLGTGSGSNLSGVYDLEKSCMPITANMYITITNTNVKLPRAPIVDIIILNNTFIVVHDWANFNTRNWNNYYYNHIYLKFRDCIGSEILLAQIVPQFIIVMQKVSWKDGIDFDKLDDGGNMWLRSISPNDSS